MSDASGGDISQQWKGLPIAPVLAQVAQHLARDGQVVLQAPPGAGKTTCVPLYLLEQGGFSGRCLMLEPRRLAARSAALRMAEMLGEPVGARVGYRMRGAAKLSARTRIEVVTEGVLTRMIQSDPALDGVGLVIFDEFHERALQADLGLALVGEARAALRDDLRLLVMSATLDAAPVAEMLAAPVVTSQGRSFEVETRWLERPLPRGPARWPALLRALTQQIAQLVAEMPGSVLVFLPGAREIRDLEAALALPGDVDIRPLYGALPFAAQKAAIARSAQRKVVLATSIAETSLTIEDISIVIDAGLARRARFDPGSGMTRLVTEPVSRAEADQRRGRAGRVAAGLCLRLWTRAEEGALPAFPPAEIEAADLAPLALELANWGAAPGDLAFLTPPPEGAFAAAERVLQMLGGLDDAGRITPYGRQMAALPLHPRLAHMLLRAGPEGADLAARLGIGATATSPRDLAQSQHQMPTREIAREIKRLRKLAPAVPQSLSLAEQAALAYPDRIGMRRKGDTPRYVLSGGQGAYMAGDDPLAAARLIVATNLDGAAREARIRQAVEISEAELRGLYRDQIRWVAQCEWDKRRRMVAARSRECLGALVLKDMIWRDAPADAISQALMAGIRDLGLEALEWGRSARLLRARVQVCQGAEGLPDWSDAALLDGLEHWLAPFAEGLRDAAGLKSIDLAAALRASLTWEQQQTLDRRAPAKLTTPLGRELAVDYSGEVPQIAVRIQEMFGTTTHPEIAGQPVRLVLLSPGQKPVQVTTDLPGFWERSYTEVAKEMRGRYPKHPWPADPRQADPTLRAKPRGK